MDFREHLLSLEGGESLPAPGRWFRVPLNFLQSLKYNCEVIFSLEKDFSTIKYTQDANILFLYFIFNNDLKPEMELKKTNRLC